MPSYPYRYLCNVETHPGGGLAKFARSRSAPYVAGDSMIDAWCGQVEADDELAGADVVFALHNDDDRPTGQICPSMSVGDVAVVGTRAFACLPVGWVEVEAPTRFFPGTWEELAVGWA